MRWTSALVIALVLTGYRHGAACGGPYGGNLHNLAQSAVLADDIGRAKAIEALRQAGPTPCSTCITAQSSRLWRAGKSRRRLKRRTGTEFAWPWMPSAGSATAIRHSFTGIPIWQRPRRPPGETASQSCHYDSWGS